MTHPVNRTLAVFLILLALGGCASGEKRLAPFPVSARPVAAVMDFEYRASSPTFASSAAGLADSVTAALVRTGRLKLVERRRLEAALSEAKLGLSGIGDARSTAELGRVLGAEYLIVGSITNVSIRDEGRSVGFAAKTTRIVDIQAEARMLETKTGLLVSSGRAAGTASGAEKHAFGGKAGSLPSQESLVHQALEGLGERLAQDLAADLQPAR